MNFQVAPASEYDYEVIEYLFDQVMWEYENSILMPVDNFVDKCLYFYMSVYEQDLFCHYEEWESNTFDVDFRGFLVIHIEYIFWRLRLVSEDLFPQREVW